MDAFLAQVTAAIQGFGGFSWMLKVSTIITLVIASMKVSFLNTWIWSKLGAAQAWLAPILGLAAGIFSLGTGITLQSAIAYAVAGGGAVFLHEILDTIKALPVLGSPYVTVINIIEGFLGGPAASSSTPVSS